MLIKKRNGNMEELDITKIRVVTIPSCENLEGVSYEELELGAELMFEDGMSSVDIQNVLIQTALNKIDVDTPNYTYVAQRLALHNLYHEIKCLYNVKGGYNPYDLISLKDYIEFNKDRLSEWYTKYSDEEINELNTIIDSNKDLLFDYLGYVTCRDRSLIKKTTTVVSNGSRTYVDTVTELPQHFHMGVAMFIAQNEKPDIRLQIVKDLYVAYSSLELINPTPVNSNGRLKKGGLISCLLGTVPDSLEGIYDMAKEVAFGSKIGAGWGVDWARVRAIGGSIAGFKGVAGGKIPFLKVFNSTGEAVNQLG